MSHKNLVLQLKKHPIVYKLLIRLLLYRGWAGFKNRQFYQRQFVNFDIKPTNRVLDIGCGDFPFPRADVHADLSTQPSGTIKCDIQAMPFPDKAFDFIYCAHTLEHIDNPLQACQELMRVGKRGYIETPTIFHDIMCSWGFRAGHKWGVMAIGNSLICLQYSDRQREGLRSNLLDYLVAMKLPNPLQGLYFRNQDVFNTMFLWEDSFDVYVFRLAGNVESLKGNEYELERIRVTQ